MLLNAAQRQAVEHSRGPLLVLAGAGSGKTRVITARIAALIKQGVRAESILAVSFTNKAAGELHERMQSICGADTADRLWLSTFHSFGLRFLREEYKALGFDGSFVIYDQSDSLSLVRELLREEGMAERRLDVNAIFNRISLWKNALSLPSAAKVAGNEYDSTARGIYKHYQESLRAMHAVDFDDLVLAPVQILRSDETIREKWQARFTHLLVDEFQDTNSAQLELVKLLTNALRNVCVVGDDDQAIYGWRGANVENILDFEKHFSGTHVVKLQDNYRSRSPILQVANAAIAQSNKKVHLKELRSARGAGERVRITVVADPSEEARFVCQEIHALKREGALLKDIAILCRSNTQGQLLEEELRIAGLPYRVYGGTQIFDRKEIKDAVAYLRLVMNPRDDLSLRRVINYPPRGVGRTSVEKLSVRAKAAGVSMYTVLKSSKTIDLSDRASKGSEEFVAAIERARVSVKKASLSAAARQLFVDIRIDEYIQSLPKHEAERKRQNIAFFLRALERYESSSHDAKPSIGEFLNRLALGNDEERQQNDGHEVTLSSLHSAKGLEFSVVFLIGCVEGVLPHHRTTDPKITDAISADIDEERRLFYVGVTRAKDLLYLCRARERTHRGRVVTLTPSRFLQGLPEASTEEYRPSGQEPMDSGEISEMATALLASLARK